jgi:hypothetical protein
MREVHSQQPRRAETVTLNTLLWVCANSCIKGRESTKGHTHSYMGQPCGWSDMFRSYLPHVPHVETKYAASSHVQTEFSYA